MHRTSTNRSCTQWVILPSPLSLVENALSACQISIASLELSKLVSSITRWDQTTLVAALPAKQVTHIKSRQPVQALNNYRCQQKFVLKQLSTNAIISRPWLQYSISQSLTRWWLITKSVWILIGFRPTVRAGGKSLLSTTCYTAAMKLLRPRKARLSAIWSKRVR